MTSTAYGPNSIYQYMTFEFSDPFPKPRNAAYDTTKYPGEVRFGDVSYQKDVVYMQVRYKLILQPLASETSHVISRIRKVFDGVIGWIYKDTSDESCQRFEICYREKHKTYICTETQTSEEIIERFRRGVAEKLTLAIHQHNRREESRRRRESERSSRREIAEQAREARLISPPPAISPGNNSSAEERPEVRGQFVPETPPDRLPDDDEVVPGTPQTPPPPQEPHHNDDDSD